MNINQVEINGLPQNELIKKITAHHNSGSYRLSENTLRKIYIRLNEIDQSSPPPPPRLTRQNATVRNRRNVGSVARHLNFGQEETPLGGKRKTKKSRKSRKNRKSRKSKKNRKSRKSRK